MNVAWTIAIAVGCTGTGFGWGYWLASRQWRRMIERRDREIQAALAQAAEMNRPMGNPFAFIAPPEREP